MPLRDLLKKKDKITDDEVDVVTSPTRPVADEFTFIRTDTHTEEVIVPPAFEDDVESPTSPRKKFLPFRKASNASTRSHASSVADEGSSGVESGLSNRRRLSQRLHLTSKARAASASSQILPPDLPNISIDPNAAPEEKEAIWEKRATILAQKSPLQRASMEASEWSEHLSDSNHQPPTRQKSVSDLKSDENIQEAIRLHEAGDLETSTQMFGRLAESGNVLSQVMYGLALRHGWGCTPDPPRAITYLSSAASNSAAIEAEALKSGVKKGGAAKGELVLAIFELANCFRHGWGIEKDAAAARQYYETAANLGDTDAMAEAAWCYLEGFGGKKDKFKAAQFLRQSEKSGVKILGNSWIWKEKYNPPSEVTVKGGK